MSLRPYSHTETNLETLTGQSGIDVHSAFELPLNYCSEWVHDRFEDHSTNYTLILCRLILTDSS